MRLVLILGLSMALVAASAESLRPGAAFKAEHTSGAKARVDSAGFMPRLKPRLTLEAGLSEVAVHSGGTVLSGPEESFIAGSVAGGLALMPEVDNGSPAVFEIEFTNAKMFPAHWLLKLNPDGSGRFDAEGGEAIGLEKEQIVAGDVHRRIQLSSEFTAHVFSTARQRKLFAMQCESHAKVAFQGTKRLSYSGPEGSGQCEYNYAKDKEIQSLGDSLLAVENTLMYAARL